MVERDPYNGIRQSLILSMVAAGAMVLVALMGRQTYVAIMFGFMAYGSFNTLQSYQGRGGGPWNTR